jgi:hypothetical protein
MSDRVERLVELGTLQRETAGDEEVLDIWRNAVRTYRDARSPGLSPKSRLVLGYDAGRLAAHALVRSRDLRVRASNHHETTLKTAAYLSSPELASALFVLDDLRSRRHALEYGWGTTVSDAAAAELLDNVLQVLTLAAESLRTHRPALAGQLSTEG